MLRWNYRAFPHEMPHLQHAQTAPPLSRHQRGNLLHLLLEASLSSAGAVDSDARDALQSLIRTYRTLQSGLIYETRPTNLIAGGIHQRLQEAIEELRKELAQKNATPLRDVEIL